MYNRGISTIVVVIDEQIIEGIVIDNLFLKIKEVFDFLNISLLLLTFFLSVVFLLTVFLSPIFF